MRHLILIAVIIGSFAVGAYYSWTGLYHPSSLIEEVIIPIDRSVEDLCTEKNCQIINSGMLFGSRGKFQEVNNNLIEVNNPTQLFVFDSAVYRGWIVEDYDVYKVKTSKAYWTENSYYFSETYKITKGMYLSPDTLKYNTHIWSNWWLIVLLIIAEGLAAVLIFWLIERKIFDRNY